MKIILAILTTLSFQSAFAFESVGHGLLVTTFSPCLTVLYYSGGFKVVHAAKEDAAMMVATEGEFKTAELMNAIAIVRASDPDLNVTDLDIALFILQL
ncbi:hypothetical protein D3C72_1585900 [compost metagenome]